MKTKVRNKNTLFSVFFEDSSHFIGGESYLKTKWLDIPKNKKIKHIFYRLPDGNHLCLKGYDKFFHMVEKCQDLTGKNKGKARIEYAYIMGLKDNKVTSYRITLFTKNNDRYKLGDIVRREFDINSDKIQKLNRENWRG